MVRETIRADWVVEIGDNLWIIGPDRITEVTILEGTLEDIVDKIIEEIMEMKGINNYNRDRNRLRERTFTRNYSSNRDRRSSNSRSRSGSRANTKRDRIRCYKCREYDHFTKDCPNSREERDLEQLQQMLNMEEQNHRTESSDDDYRSPLNL